MGNSTPVPVSISAPVPVPSASHYPSLPPARSSATTSAAQKRSAARRRALRMSAGSVLPPLEDTYNAFSGERAAAKRTQRDELCAKFKEALEAPSGSWKQTEAWAAAVGLQRVAERMKESYTVWDLAAVSRMSQLRSFARLCVAIESHSELSAFVTAVVEFQWALGKTLGIHTVVLEVWFRQLRVAVPTDIQQLIVLFSNAQQIPLLFTTQFTELSLPSFVYHSGDCERVAERIVRGDAHLRKRMFWKKRWEAECGSLMLSEKASEIWTCPLPQTSIFTDDAHLTLDSATIEYTPKRALLFKIQPGDLEWIGIDALHISSGGNDGYGTTFVEHVKVCSLYVSASMPLPPDTVSSLVSWRTRSRHWLVPECEKLTWIPVGKRVIVLKKTALKQEIKINWMSPVPFSRLKLVLETSWTPEEDARDNIWFTVSQLQIFGYASPTM